MGTTTVPTNTQENTLAIDKLMDRLDSHDVHNAKVDVILERLVQQSDTFEKAVTQFQTAITKLETQATFRDKALNVAASIILLVAGTCAGQFIHFHP